MSTTLTNGLKLPDKGSVDWYADMQNNYSILDGAVGTVAEHTTQIAGKAPAVHTHTKSDITDFPAYGTTAGTICEGNDSRLSDARTPVAHTHIKADVTDLLNSNFIPSANNSYDLGSSSYQWNNLYAKNYYYNGTPWGLDAWNTWTGSNVFKSQNTNLALQSTVSEMGSLTSSSNWFRWVDKNGAQNAYISRDVWSDGADTLRIAIIGKRANGAPSISGTEIDCGIRLNIDADGTKSVTPFDNNINLGTSTNKWKILNGINPGALSLPNIEASVNLAGDITDFTGATQLSLNSGSIGWVYIQIPNVQGDYIEVQIGNSASIRYFVSAGYSDSLDSIEVLVPKPPVVTKVRVKATGGAVSKALFYPCQGNV